MQRSLRSRFSAWAAAAASGLLLCAPVHAANNQNAVLTLFADPTTASISRDPSGSDPGASYLAAYTVRIFNPTNSSKNFRFVGNVTVDPDVTTVPSSAPPTQFVSSRPDCTLTGTNPVAVVCPKLEVAKGATINLRFQFRTPTAGTKMTLGAALYFPASNGTLTASGSSSITLVKLTQPEYTLGFNTFVPPTGGTFFSGNASASATGIGGVATPTDPFTTTIVVPNIGFSTTATVVEQQQGERADCSAFFYPAGGCFGSDLTIPSAANALAGLRIFLRIDSTKVYSNASIGSAVIRYTKDGTNFIDVPNCSATVVAISGRPCIRNRKVYGIVGVPAEWQLDWEFEIEATDNGRYIN